jgi:proteasome lid subunit RPN8/RPN11
MKNQTDFEAYILAEYPKEACGYILKETFYPVENIHSDPLNFFEFPEKVSLSLLGKAYSILHSHTPEKFTLDPRIPSETDMKSQQSSGVPWGIVYCDGEIVSEPLWFSEVNMTPYIGRIYIPNVQDCFTLARDYYNIERNIDFGIHPRPVNWEEWNPLYIEQNFKDLGFTEVIEAQDGDILLLSIAASYINHIGVYLGKDQFLHHLANRTSSQDSVIKWQRHIYKILRYSDGR